MNIPQISHADAAAMAHGARVATAGHPADEFIHGVLEEARKLHARKQAAKLSKALRYPKEKVD